MREGMMDLVEEGSEEVWSKIYGDPEDDLGMSM